MVLVCICVHFNDLRGRAVSFRHCVQRSQIEFNKVIKKKYRGPERKGKSSKYLQINPKSRCLTLRRSLFINCCGLVEVPSFAQAMDFF